MDGSAPIYTPAVCLTEIASKYLRAGRDPRDRTEFILDRSLVIDIDAHIALDAANLRHEYGLHTVDALVYASSRSRGKPLVTGDEHFRNVPDVEML